MTSQVKRICRVCDFIGQNLDGDLSLETLSQMAAFSKYHFHRVFSAYTGLGVTRFIQLARLKRASFRVAFEKDLKIIDIALEAGFDSPEAFSRAFKREIGQSPSQFRAAPEWPAWHSTFQVKVPSQGPKTMQVNIVDFPETRVARIEHWGPRERVYETAEKFVAWRKDSQLSPVATSKTFGVPYSDPNTTEPDEFRFDICGSIDQQVPENRYGVKSGILPGGRCAVIRHQGSHEAMDDTIYYLYREWLPQSGEDVRDFPCFFHYLNLVHEVDECDLLTDIYLPLKTGQV